MEFKAGMRVRVHAKGCAFCPRVELNQNLTATIVRKVEGTKYELKFSDDGEVRCCWTENFMLDDQLKLFKYTATNHGDKTVITRVSLSGKADELFALEFHGDNHAEEANAECVKLNS